MKTKLFLLTLTLSISFSFHAFAQWPGNFYAFILTDASGNIIKPENKDYKMIAIDDTTIDVVVGIKICSNDTVWRFYEGGNHYMGSTQKLKIIKEANGKAAENMIIEFPPSFSKGKEQYYRDLYAGKLKFKNGTIIIKLPRTGEQWDHLKEMKLCEDGTNFTSYYDVSDYQK